MIVVDTNIVAYLSIEGERTAQARVLWDSDPHWQMPIIWQHEYLNILSTYTRSDGIGLEDAKHLWKIVTQKFIDAHIEIDMSVALDLAVQHNISAYDAQFIALANELEVPLISEDKRLRDRCPERVINMAEYIDRS